VPAAIALAAGLSCMVPRPSMRTQHPSVVGATITLPAIGLVAATDVSVVGTTLAMTNPPTSDIHFRQT
jgi:hypothetical protein